MRYLIVNADDLGLSSGVNRGIVKACALGVVTSASLIVNSEWSRDAVELIGEVPKMSIGLHVNLEGAVGDVKEELRAQISVFHELVGRPPTHIDSHHDDHRRPDLLPHFLEFAARHDVPLRAHSSIRSLTSFYGRWDDQSHPDHIGVEGLMRLLMTIGNGVTELACHPGESDPQLRSSYASERQIELKTLCNPLIPEAMRELGIELIGFSEVSTSSLAR